MRHFIPGVEPAMDKLGMSLIETVERTGAEIGAVLSGRRLALNELGAEIATRIARRLPKGQRDIWDEEGPYAPDQPLGEGVVHFCIRILTLQRVICLAPRAGEQGNVRPGRRVAWASDPDIDPEVARAELLRATCAVTDRRDARTSPRGRGSVPVTPTLVEPGRG